MGSRYLGIVSLERFLAVERYYECRRPVAPAQPRRAPEPVGRSSAERPGTDRTPARSDEGAAARAAAGYLSPERRLCLLCSRA
jgi:hypothetical protein